MVIKSRLTVLFESPEDVGSHISYNATHLTVAGDENVIMQQRWMWELPQSEINSTDVLRITWRAGKVTTGPLYTIINPVLSSGFNVYTTSDEIIGLEVNSPVYNSLHISYFDLKKIKDFLPEIFDTSFVDWKWERCDLDIRLEDGHLHISQWCPLTKNETITFGKCTAIDKSEAGLFYVDSQDQYDISLSGLRCNWDASGDIDKCQKTMLIYKPAHFHENFQNKALYDLEKPVGLHPKLLIDLKNVTESTGCEYFMYLQLPVDIFVDKFQSSPLLVFGMDDLELPEYKLRDKAWGSEALFKLEPGRLNEITLHSRYVEPVEGGDYKPILFEPILFRSCGTNSEKIEHNPFYSKGLGYESFFTADTVFYHMNSISIHAPIPTPDAKFYNNIQYVTLACLILSLLYLLQKIFGNRNAKAAK